MIDIEQNTIYIGSVGERFFMLLLFSVQIITI